MTTDILKRRLKRFEAWNKALSNRKGRSKNPYHETERSERSKSTDFGMMKKSQLEKIQLESELAAWEEASDDDFESFEQSLG